MNKENAEFLNDSLQIKACKNSYLKKEDLIKILEDLNFTEVKDIRLTCITGYQIKVNDKGDKYIYPLGFEINID